MYHSAVQRSPTEEEDRQRRDNTMAGTGVQQLPPFDARSPTHAHFPSYPPTVVNGQQTSYTAYSSRPSSSAAVSITPGINQSPRLGPPPSPTNGLSHINRAAYPPREGGTSTYYDPTSEHREISGTWNQPSYQGQSPIQNRDSIPYIEQTAEHGKNRSSHPSPVSARFSHHSPTYSNLHAHPTSRQNSVPQSPGQVAATSPHVQHSNTTYSHTTNGSDRPPSANSRLGPCIPERGSEESKPARADPMAFSSILSDNTADIEQPKPITSHGPPLKPIRKSSKSFNSDLPSTPNGSIAVSPSPRKLSNKSSISMKEEHGPPDAVVELVKPKANKSSSPLKRTVASTSDKENDRVRKAMVDIDLLEVSDSEGSNWLAAREQHREMSRKRQIAVEEAEFIKRKCRRISNTTKISSVLSTFDKAGKAQFRDLYEDATIAEVQQKEIMDEKERKKEMQRKRRREKTVQNETQKQREAIERAQLALDNAEREKFLKEAQRAEKRQRLQSVF